MRVLVLKAFSVNFRPNVSNYTITKACYRHVRVYCNDLSHGLDQLHVGEIDWTLKNKKKEGVLHWICKSNLMTFGVDAICKWAFDMPDIKRTINDVDIFGDTPLHHLLRSRQPEPSLVKVFIQNGAKLDIKNDMGWTCTDYLFLLVNEDQRSIMLSM